MFRKNYQLVRNDLWGEQKCLHGWETVWLEEHVKCCVSTLLISVSGVCWLSNDVPHYDIKSSRTDYPHITTQYTDEPFKIWIISLLITGHIMMVIFCFAWILQPWSITGSVDRTLILSYSRAEGIIFISCDAWHISQQSPRSKVLVVSSPNTCSQKREAAISILICEHRRQKDCVISG